jgi:hypothetical protein
MSPARCKANVFKKSYSPSIASLHARHCAVSPDRSADRADHARAVATRVG